jgi:hypothetical protein
MTQPAAPPRSSGPTDLSTILLVVATGAIVLAFGFSLVFKPNSATPVASGPSTTKPNPTHQNPRPTTPPPPSCSSAQLNLLTNLVSTATYDLVITDPDPNGLTVTWPVSKRTWALIGGSRGKLQRPEQGQVKLVLKADEIGPPDNDGQVHISLNGTVDPTNPDLETTPPIIQATCLPQA